MSNINNNSNSVHNDPFNTQGILDITPATTVRREVARIQEMAVVDGVSLAKKTATTAYYLAVDIFGAAFAVALSYVAYKDIRATGVVDPSMWLHRLGIWQRGYSDYEIEMIDLYMEGYHRWILDESFVEVDGKFIFLKDYDPPRNYVPDDILLEEWMKEEELNKEFMMNEMPIDQDPSFLSQLFSMRTVFRITLISAIVFAVSCKKYGVKDTIHKFQGGLLTVWAGLQKVWYVGGQLTGFLKTNVPWLYRATKTDKLIWDITVPFFKQQGSTAIEKGKSLVITSAKKTGAYLKRTWKYNLRGQITLTIVGLLISIYLYRTVSGLLPAPASIPADDQEFSANGMGDNETFVG